LQCYSRWYNGPERDKVVTRNNSTRKGRRINKGGKKEGGRKEQEEYEKDEYERRK
jgi:hypothetical protein